MGASGPGYQGLGTITTLLTDISKTPMSAVEAIMPAAAGVGDRDDTQGGISRLQLSLSVRWGRIAVRAGGSGQRLCVKLPVLPAGFV